jgi:hypothetical protein
MPVTTPEIEYKRLRSYLNPYIRGPGVDAILMGLAAGSSSYLINNASAVNDQMYIVTAEGQYLDYRLAEFGITRPTNVGLSDEIFTQIGLQVKNRKQVRDLMDQILDAIFGDEFTKASDPARMLEPYNLQDGDTLIINFDSNTTTTITFSTSQFENIHAATAQEVADVITSTLSAIGVEGTAISQNDGNGNYVNLISNTIGPRSSVTVLGGSAENVLLFDAPVNAVGNSTTQWTVTLQPGGFLRYTWSGGANPNTGDLTDGNYVNIYGGGFTGSPNAGTYTITQFRGGVVDVAYFEVSNPLGVAGIFTQGTNTSVLFFNPVRHTLNSLPSYAALYQVQAKVLQVFLPASTKVIRRSRLGSAHLHYPPQGTFLFNQQPNDGDVFSITSTYSITISPPLIGLTIEDTVNNLVEAINAADVGLLALNNTNNTVVIYNQLLTNTLTITYTGAANILPSGPLGSNVSLEPNQPGPYIYDLSQPFVVSHVNTTLTNTINADSSRVVQVASSVGIPNAFGYVIFGYGTSHQEGPVPYLGTPSNTTILISPTYTIQKVQPAGTSVFFVAQNSPATIDTIGDQYPFYLTDVVSGRIYAQNLLQSVAAAGISIVFTILYPSDIGLGKWGTIYSENPIIWGP